MFPLLYPQSTTYLEMAQTGPPFLDRRDGTLGIRHIEVPNSISDQLPNSVPIMSPLALACCRSPGHAEA